jgi:hypothetical protein
MYAESKIIEERERIRGMLKNRVRESSIGLIIPRGFNSLIPVS